MARAVDGSRTVRRELRPGEFWVDASEKLWLPDSRSWVGLLAGEKSLYAVVQSLDQSGIRSKVALGFPKWTVAFPDLMPSDLLGFVAEERVLARPQQDGRPRRGKLRSVPFYEFSLSAPTGNLREYSIELPSGTDDGAVVLSPDGRQLAWVLYVTPEDEQGNPGERQEIRIGVSHTDGTGMRVLAALPLAGESADRKPESPRLSWFPAGKSVAFSYRQEAWSVPDRR